MGKYLGEKWDGTMKLSGLLSVGPVKSGTSYPMRVRSSLTGTNDGLLTLFLGTQIPSLLMLVKGNGARYFEEMHIYLFWNSDDDEKR